MKNVVIKFTVEMDGEVLAKVAKCLKEYEPGIFSIMHEQFKPAFDEILNEGIRESCEEFCEYCHKRIKMQGNGIIEPLCECGNRQNSLERT